MTPQSCTADSMVFSDLAVQSTTTWRELANETYVYTAYYDAGHNATWVKVIGLSNRNASLFCHVWDGRGEATSSGKAILEVPIHTFK